MLDGKLKKWRDFGSFPGCGICVDSQTEDDKEHSSAKLHQTVAVSEPIILAQQGM